MLARARLKLLPELWSPMQCTSGLSGPAQCTDFQPFQVDPLSRIGLTHFMTRRECLSDCQAALKLLPDLEDPTSAPQDEAQLAKLRRTAAQVHARMAAAHTELQQLPEAIASQKQVRLQHRPCVVVDP